jgi:hypothetical protein
MSFLLNSLLRRSRSLLTPTGSNPRARDREASLMTFNVPLFARLIPLPPDRCCLLLLTKLENQLTVEEEENTLFHFFLEFL